MDDTSSNSLEIKTESFMVKVQFEQQTGESGSPQWHGVIVHIASGAVFHFDTLHEIESIVIPYLQAHGIPFDSSQQ